MPKQRKRLLDNVTGYIRTGQLMALVGSSGAGKSTLLDVLARRKTGGHISGAVEVNRQPQMSSFTVKHCVFFFGRNPNFCI